MSELTEQEQRKRNKLQVEKPRVYEKIMQYPQRLVEGKSCAIVQLQYDYKCNLRCRHCSISDFQKLNKDRYFTPENIKDLSKQMDEYGLAQIGFSGGEPLVFKDLDAVIANLDPSKFHIQLDTNGWLMSARMAKHLKEIGIDKIQLSLDSLNAKEHDNFRRADGSHARALRAIDHILDAGLEMHLATVVTHQRIRSDEFIQFLEFAKKRGLGVAVVWPKPVGEWTNNFEVMITPEDVAYLDELRKTYNAFDHMIPGYGLDVGCLAVKRIISITKWGDVMPCPWIFLSLGNVFDTPLKDILEKGMRYFGKRSDVCLTSNNPTFIKNYIVPTYNKDLPVPIEEVFRGKDGFAL